jgi:hypothetical protein
MRLTRFFAICVAAVSGCLALGAACAEADEYEGFALLNDASVPQSLTFSGGSSFSVTVYEDKDKACPGQNATFATVRQGVLGTTTGWVRLSYKDCKENVALLCVDADLAAKGPLPNCTSVTTRSAPGPTLIESFAGAVTFSDNDDDSEPSIGLIGTVFNIAVTPDNKNACKGKDNFAAVRKFLRSLKDDQSIRISFKNCTPGFALVCIDPATTGDFKPKVCASVATPSSGGSVD